MDTSQQPPFVPNVFAWHASGTWQPAVAVAQEGEFIRVVFQDQSTALLASAQLVALPPAPVVPGSPGQPPGAAPGVQPAVGASPLSAFQQGCLESCAAGCGEGCKQGAQTFFTQLMLMIIIVLLLGIFFSFCG